MKATHFLFFLSMFFVMSCKKKEGLIGFDVSYDVDITIPSSAGVSVPISFPTPDVQTSSSSTFSNNNTSADKIKSIILEELELTINSPSGKTFSFLESIKIYISAEGLDERLLAWKDNVANDVGSVLLLDTSEDSFSDYIKKDEFDLRTEIVTDETLVQDVEINAKMDFRVRASPL